MAIIAPTVNSPYWKTTINSSFVFVFLAFPNKIASIQEAKKQHFNL